MMHLKKDNDFEALRNILDHDGLLAIGLHNYDVERKVTVHSGLPPFDLNMEGVEYFQRDRSSGQYGDFKRENVEASSMKTPELFVVRIADNLDFSHHRLSRFQDQYSTMHVLSDMWKWAKDFDVGHQELPDELLVEKQKKLELSLQLHTEENSVSKSTFLQINELIPRILHNQFPHWYGNWIVESVFFNKMGIDDYLLEIQFRDVDIDDPLYWAKNIREAIYQVERAADALSTCMIKDRKKVRAISEIIYVKIHYFEMEWSEWSATPLIPLNNFKTKAAEEILENSL